MCEINARLALRGAESHTPHPRRPMVNGLKGSPRSVQNKRSFFVNAAAIHSCQHCAGGAGCDVWPCEGQGARAFFSHIPESITFCFKHCFRHLCIPSVSCIRWRRGVHVRSRSATLCFGTRDVPDENGRCFAQRALLLDVNSLIRSTVALPCGHVSREQVGWRDLMVMCAWYMCVRVCV